MTDTAFWVLLLSLLAVVVVLRLAAELLRDINFDTQEPVGDAELRCFFCAGDPKLCRCRDEIFNTN